MTCCLKLIVAVSLLAYGTSGKAKTVFEFFKISQELISLSFDIGSHLNKGDDDIDAKMKEIQNQIKEAMEYIDMKIDKLRHLLTEEIFFNGLNRDIQDIKSCLKEYDYFQKHMNDKGIRENFWNRCNGIITPLRKIRNILTGGKVIANNALVNHLKDKEGFCNGTTISEVILYISRFYVEGCATFVLAQKYKHGNSSRHYLEECNDGLSDISAYMKAFYESCAKIACSDDFQSELSSVVNDVVIGKAANETVSNLKGIFPYLEIIVIQKNLKSSDKCSIPVSDKLKHKTFRGKEFQFDVYALQSSFKESNISNQNKSVIEVPSSTFTDIATSDIKVESIYVNGMTFRTFFINVPETPCFREIKKPSSAATAMASSLLLIIGLFCWQFVSLKFTA